MTKIDHEKQNRKEKANKNKDGPALTCAAPESKTTRRSPMLKKSRGRPKKPKKSTLKPVTKVKCKTCIHDVYVYSKNIMRHNYLVHDVLSCPFCHGQVAGYKKLGRHIKKKHGHNKYRQFKSKSI